MVRGSDPQMRYPLLIFPGNRYRSIARNRETAAYKILINSITGQNPLASPAASDEIWCSP